MIFIPESAINWPELTKQVAAFGEKFRGRYDDDLLDDALVYVKEGELGLALDVICGQICDFGVQITELEYFEAKRLLDILDVEYRDLDLEYMNKLIVK